MDMKLCVHKAVSLDAKLYCLIYDVQIDIAFIDITLYILPSVNSKKYQSEDMLNTKGLSSLIEYQQVG